MNEETRNRVLQAIKKLHYVPQKPGRKSSNSRQKTKRKSASTRTIGLLLSNGIMTPYMQGDPYYGRLLGGVYQAADHFNYHLMVGIHDNGKHALPLLVTLNKVDGLLIDVEIPPAIQTQLMERLPVIYLDKSPSKTGTSSVETNIDSAANDILDYLWENGHRDIACFLPATNPLLADRIAFVYERFFASKKYQPRMGLLNTPRSISEEAHVQVLAAYARELLAASPRPTALFAWDTYACRLLVELGRLGIRIPEEISVVGIDDTPAALQVDPQLSSYRFPLDEMGRTAVEILLQKIADPSRASRQIFLEGEIIVRGSSGPVNPALIATA